jgi:hypothetical protein
MGVTALSRPTDRTRRAGKITRCVPESRVCRPDCSVRASRRAGIHPQYRQLSSPKQPRHPSQLSKQLAKGMAGFATSCPSWEPMVTPRARA